MPVHKSILALARKERVRSTLGKGSTMETIHIVLDRKLLKATDLAAKRRKVNRSALIRHALQEYLKHSRILELE
jgi:hypothetical protein